VVSFAPEALRDEKMKVLSAVRPVSPSDVVRGQYGAGKVGRRQLPAYREEDGVRKRSTVETYAALRFWVDNWRWAGVPFYVRTGKRLPRRVTEVTMAFRDAPHALFPEGRPGTNHLTLRIQPDEGIVLTFDAKMPGPQMRTVPVNMEFSYAEQFGAPPAEAYERLLRDAMSGDHSLFPRSDEVERAWSILEPVLRDPPAVHGYPSGTWGPKAAGSLVDWHLCR
jgi:glucose-6-phosphate 1-dehydrogenase